MPKPNTVTPLDHISITSSWWRRFIAQYWALLWYKAGRVAFRNFVATLLRAVIAPLLFMLLTFVVTKGIEAAPQNKQVRQSVATRPFSAVSPIPDCTTDAYYTSQLTCWDLFYSPNTSSTIVGIVEAMRLNNPGRPIPADRVLGFASSQDSNAFLLANLGRRVNGAVHFNASGAAVSYVLQTNSTVRSFRSQFQDPTFWSAVPIQAATERELARYNYGLAGQDFDPQNWRVETAGYPHPSLTAVSLVGQILGPFLFASNMFGFVLVMSAVVGERELRLRQAMRTMGLLDSAYWTSWATSEVVLALVTSILTCAFGSLFQFTLFYDNSFALPFLTFLLFQLAMSSFAFLVSVWVKSSSTAVNLGFVIFIIGWIMQLVEAFGFPYTPEYLNSNMWAAVVFSLFPWSLLAKAVSDLGDAVIPGNPGISWGSRSSYCQNLSQTEIAQQPATPGQYRDFQCVLPLNTIFWILVAEWLVYLALAVYLDNIIPDENGSRRPLWYIFLPNYWRPSRRRNLRRKPGMVQTASGGQLLKPMLQLSEAQENVDEGVAAEQAKVEELLQHRRALAGSMASQAVGSENNAVEIFGLQKVYRGTSRMRKWVCCGRKSRPDFWAIKGAWLEIPEGQLFCLLGPNGAGKTTTINCLTGIVRPSGGDALVHGEALSSPGGIDRIRSVMGVCPQFDILWKELTGREHLLIYGNLKGIPPKAARLQTEELLAKVRLTEAANVRSGSYSGGMKRRLSVAIALLGDPKIVFLDEPTTGMDPISRRHVWDIIQEAKQGRAIVLTTHSMEEADVLGDRIAIMARGHLRCIGSSLHLKQRFGAGYQLSLTTADLNQAKGDRNGTETLEKHAATKAFVAQNLGQQPTEEAKAYLQYRIPRSAEASLPAFLAALKEQQGRLGVTDVQISLTSLEDVFLRIAQQAEQEAAAASGTKHKVFTPDGRELEVEVGAEEAEHPDSGDKFRIRWAQDDAGALQVLEAIPLSEH